MRYTYAFLRDYFSARGLTLSRSRSGRQLVYRLTNGVRSESFVGLSAVALRAACGQGVDYSVAPWETLVRDWRTAVTQG
jgi:hypothetical protein